MRTSCCELTVKMYRGNMYLTAMERYVLITIVFIFCICKTASVTSDPRRCKSRPQKSSFTVFEKEYCLVTKDDVKLTCSPNEMVIFTSLLIATKRSRADCMKRVLTRNDDFCCNSAANDMLYESQCLQDFWNREDTVHYQQFIIDALARCKNTSRCVLNSKLFANLQTEIPIIKEHSSYFQILYQCIPAPSESISFCSSHSVKGKGVHLLNSVNSAASNEKICKCRVSLQGEGNVTVRAVNIEDGSSGLNFDSITRRNISLGQTPLFGLRELITGKRIGISVKRGSKDTEDRTWIHLYASGSNGKDVSVTCGAESPPQEEIAPAGHVYINTEKTVFWGYWPLIYIACGSIFTIIIVVCIWGGVVIWRYRRNGDPPHPACSHPSLPSAAEFKMYPNGHLYATVRDDSPQLLDPRVAVPRPVSRYSMERMRDMPYMRTYGVSPSPRSIHNRTAPQDVAPDISVGGPATEDSSRLSATLGTSCDASELETLIMFRDQT